MAQGSLGLLLWSVLGRRLEELTGRISSGVVMILYQPSKYAGMDANFELHGEDSWCRCTIHLHWRGASEALERDKPETQCSSSQ
ncbi:hypothetical protein C8R43DRAFT_1004001 [Mycena crocata]|nr:hypothetical protein C8R43DRAFT_1004001 [Mycena crocata]